MGFKSEPKERKGIEQQIRNIITSLIFWLRAHHKAAVQSGVLNPLSSSALLGGPTPQTPVHYMIITLRNRTSLTF